LLTKSPRSGSDKVSSRAHHGSMAAPSVVNRPRSTALAERRRACLRRAASPAQRRRTSRAHCWNRSASERPGSRAKPQTTKALRSHQSSSRIREPPQPPPRDQVQTHRGPGGARLDHSAWDRMPSTAAPPRWHARSRSPRSVDAQGTRDRDSVCRERARRGRHARCPVSRPVGKRTSRGERRPRPSGLRKCRGRWPSDCEKRRVD